MRTLPTDLVRQLRAARRHEQLADGLDRQREAITATGSLMLAAVEAGWTRTDIGRVLGMNHQTVAARVRTARDLYGDATPALAVDAPLELAVTPTRSATDATAGCCPIPSTPARKRSFTCERTCSG